MRVDGNDESPCAIEPVGELVFGKWTSHLLWALQHRGPMRFGDLIAQAPGATAKVVTARLRQLERDGLVSRRCFDEFPPRTEYRITELGRSLIPAFRQLADWSQTRMAEVIEARSRFDDTHNGLGLGGAR